MSKICMPILRKKIYMPLICLLWSMLILPNKALPAASPIVDTPPWNTFVLQRLHSKERQKAIERMHQEYAHNQEHAQRLQQKNTQTEESDIRIDSNRSEHEGSIDIGLSEEHFRMLHSKTALP